MNSYLDLRSLKTSALKTRERKLVIMDSTNTTSPTVWIIKNTVPVLPTVQNEERVPYRSYPINHMSILCTFQYIYFNIHSVNKDLTIFFKKFEFQYFNRVSQGNLKPYLRVHIFHKVEYCETDRIEANCTASEKNMS
jgi:hypothetical protein